MKFEDTDEIKERPVMIWNDRAFVMAFKMTSADRGDNREEFKLNYWKEAGLEKPTSIRITKILRLENNDFIRRIGRLDSRDILRFELRIAG